MTSDATISLEGSSLLPGSELHQCTLEVVEGADRGRRFALGRGRTVIGAARRCDVTLTDPAVSSSHAALSLLREGIGVEDLGSKNGTRVLGSLVKSVVVQPGATIALGHTRLAIVAPVVEEPAPVPRTRYGELIGHSVAWRRVFATLSQLEGCEATVLLQGETGVGKSAVAREIHERSPRRHRQLATIDCGAVAPSLLPSELFGHARGAFTGAEQAHEGIVAAAAGSTLLLEEVGELPLDLQPNLLRLLEAREYTPVGDNRSRTADLRVLAATNRDLAAGAEGGSFRADLYYRLSVITVRVPPLRECREDILPLASRFLEHLGQPAELTAGQRTLLESYDWPGNARQLRNAIERFTVTGELLLNSPGTPAPAPRWGEGDFHSNKAEVVRRFEHDYINVLLQHCTGNLSAAARQSGLARNHLRQLARRHGIEPASFRR